MKQLPDGQYNFTETEKKILEFWQSKPFFKPEYIKDENAPTFTIVEPPPNANGSLHLGHMSGYAYQDLMGRYNRMKGKRVLLLPGKDHAGIQTEVIFEKELEKKGINKLDLGREEFYKQCYEFCMQMSETARSQEKRLGLAADYERELFTLDPRVVNTVLETFIKLHKDGYVYKGAKIVNWCVRCQTTLADIDTEHKERDGKMVYIKYPIKDSDQFISVATSRPETMLGDVAVVVNPDDERYKSLIGKTAIIPIANREVPIIPSKWIDKEFGTGAMKLTTAHAPEDVKIADDYEKESGIRLSAINIIWKDGRLTGPIPEKYKGMKVNAAREEIIKELQSLGLLEKVENMKHNVSVCERCKSVIEPLLSSQWFIKVENLKRPAIEAVKNGEVKILPEAREKMYYQWMENLRDWPVSRQLWWGYRMPVWYKGDREEFVDDNGQIIEKIGGVEITSRNFDEVVKVSIESPGEGWIQDPDIFDTWFSSGQWPYATLMVKEGDFEKFYPTAVMETGYDILFFWVSRMIMLGLYRTGKVPFNTVYLHGLVTDKNGDKMSKSKGNGIDPYEMMQKYGTDALRYSFLMGNNPGTNYPLYEDKVKGFRNFMNKIWNASKFVMMNLEGIEQYEWFEAIKSCKSVGVIHELPLQFEPEDKEMLEKLESTEKRFDELFEKFRFGLLTEEVYNEFWHTFCDEYIEKSKSRVWKNKETGEYSSTPESRQAAQAVLFYSLKSYLRMLHPFIPFITEEIWQHLVEDGKYEEALMYAVVK
jgi:valyl-tRNA synthetase